MSARVLPQPGLLRETGAALDAAVGLLARVDPRVHLEEGAPGKRLPALLALKGLDTGVDDAVLAEVGRVSELFSALLAHVWPLARVRASVVDQVRAVRKDPATILTWVTLPATLFTTTIARWHRGVRR